MNTVTEVVVLRQVAGCAVITIPKRILDQSGFKDRDHLMIYAVDGKLTVVKADS